MNSEIQFSQQNHIGLITLNRPQALNALTLSMIIDLQKQLQLWKLDPTIEAVVIKATSPKIFCAGGDIRWLYEAQKTSDSEQLNFFWHEYRLNHFIHHFPKPYIALIDGLVMGGGVGISMHGSHPIASENFSFAMPETGIGFFPDIGASYLLNLCPSPLGNYLGLTGAKLNHHETKQANLVKQIVSSDNMEKLLEHLIHSDLSKAPKASVDACIEAFALTSDIYTKGLIRPAIECFSEPSIELILASLEKSKDIEALKIKKNLEDKSPLSLKVTLEQLARAKNKSLDYCLKMDFSLAQHFMKDHDFYEGVRALLIDKDKNPRWSPENLELVSNTMMINYFEEDEELRFAD